MCYDKFEGDNLLETLQQILPSGIMNYSPFAGLPVQPEYAACVVRDEDACFVWKTLINLHAVSVRDQNPHFNQNFKIQRNLLKGNDSPDAKCITLIVSSISLIMWILERD